LLIQCSRTAQLPQPEDYQLRFLRDWLEGDEEGGNFLPKVAGDDELLTWDVENDEDFVTLVEAQTWVNPKLQDMWDKRKPGASKRPNPASDIQLSRYLGRTTDFDASATGKSERWVSNAAFMAVMALIPILIVLWLYHVHSTLNRIYIAIGSTFVVGLLMFGITANPEGGFGATAA
jgi:hypothetical protein